MAGSDTPRTQKSQRTPSPHVTYTHAMPMRVTSPDKKAEIARDVVVAYISHMSPEQLTDLDKVSAAIDRLVDVVENTFEVPDKQPAGFGLPPSLPRPTA